MTFHQQGEGLHSPIVTGTPSRPSSFRRAVFCLLRPARPGLGAHAVRAFTAVHSALFNFRSVQFSCRSTAVQQPLLLALGDPEAATDAGQLLGAGQRQLQLARRRGAVDHSTIRHAAPCNRNRKRTQSGNSSNKNNKPWRLQQTRRTASQPDAWRGACRWAGRRYSALGGRAGAGGIRE